MFFVFFSFFLPQVQHFTTTSSSFFFLIYFHCIHIFITTMDSPLSIKDASGRQISLLNSNKQNNSCSSPSSSSSSLAAPVTTTTNDFLRATATRQPSTGRRKYHCTEPGCNKSFTTRYVLLFYFILVISRKQRLLFFLLI